MKDHDIDLDLWPEAKEAIQDAWVRGFVFGLVVACCAAGLMWLAGQLPGWLV